MSRHFERDLLAYVHGELEGRHVQDLESHLQVCESCKRELERVRRTHQGLQALGAKSAPEELWSRIETALDAPANQPVQGRRRPWSPHLALAGLAAGLAVGIWLWSSPRTGSTDRPVTAGAYVLVSADSGIPRVSGTPLDSRSGGGRLHVGQELVTGTGEVATISMKDVGDVKVMPGTRIALLHSSSKQQRLDLRSGTISAKITAKPNIFFVETPLATAVDLGCEYTLTVDARGEGKLSVITGWVELQSKSGTALVPADAECAIYPSHGVGVPYFKDAPVGCVSELSLFEKGDLTALDGILRTARPEDALTIWHLLRRTTGADRARVYDRLAQLKAPPKGVKRADVLALDDKALELWRDEIMPMNDRAFW